MRPACSSPLLRQLASVAEFGALLHVDAVQAAGRLPVNLAALGAHSIALSSHKLGGPTGAGALLLAPELSSIAPLIGGGGQERGRRGGTPALPAIAGFAAAASAAQPSPDVADLRDSIERAAIAQGAVVCGGGAERLPNTTCLILPGVRGDTQVIALDLAGVAVSAGAACSSGKNLCEPRPRGDGPWPPRRSGHPRLATLERLPIGRRSVHPRIRRDGGPAPSRPGAPSRLRLHGLP